MPTTLPRPRADLDLLTAVAGRLTSRDIAIAELLLEHQVLTTQQIAAAAFDSPISARHRLLQLYRIRIIDRFRPFQRLGSAPHHWILDETGATVLAANRGNSPADLGYRRDRALQVAHSSRLTHLIGVNTFFTALVGYSRNHPDCQLEHWWSERRCARALSAFVRPDGYGLWRTPRARTRFYLEYDRGTETLDRVAAKLDGYAALAAAQGPTAVLITVPGPRREAALRKVLSSHPLASDTTTSHAELHPAESSWLPALANQRLALSDFRSLKS